MVNKLVFMSYELKYLMQKVGHYIKLLKPLKSCIQYINVETLAGRAQKKYLKVRIQLQVCKMQQISF